MISVSKPLITSRYTGEEFRSASALNAGVSIDDLDEKVVKSAQRSMTRRRKSQTKARKSMKF